MKIQISLYGRERELIATHAPTDDPVINIKENYYEQLAEQLDKVKIIRRLFWQETLMEEWDRRLTIQ